MKIKLLSIMLFGLILTMSSVVYAQENRSSLAKMKDVCIEYAKHRLLLDQDTYTETRDSDYNTMEQKLFALGAQKVDEYANCHILNDAPYRDTYVGDVLFKKVKRCVRVKFMYQKQLYEAGYCK